MSLWHKIFKQVEIPSNTLHVSTKFGIVFYFDSNDIPFLCDYVYPKEKTRDFNHENENVSVCGTYDGSQDYFRVQSINVPGKKWPFLRF